MITFEKAGKQNTEITIKSAVERAGALGIGTIVIATTTGQSAKVALRLAKDFRIIAVTHCSGFKKNDFQELSIDTKRELEEKGVLVLTSTHAFGGIGRAVRRKFGTYEIDEIIANSLRRFGEGTKVAIEIAMMAADAGLVRTDENIISIGGTSEGTDTALIIKPANTHNFFDLKVREIICKPWDF